MQVDVQRPLVLPAVIQQSSSWRCPNGGICNDADKEWQWNYAAHLGAVSQVLSCPAGKKPLSVGGRIDNLALGLNGWTVSFTADPGWYAVSPSVWAKDAQTAASLLGPPPSPAPLLYKYFVVCAYASS